MRALSALIIVTFQVRRSTSCILPASAGAGFLLRRRFSSAIRLAIAGTKAARLRWNAWRDPKRKINAIYGGVIMSGPVKMIFAAILALAVPASAAGPRRI